MMNLEKYGPFMHSGYIGLYLVSITSFFYAYILPWQEKISLFLKSNTTVIGKKKKDLLIKSIRRIWEKSFRKSNISNF